MCGIAEIAMRSFLSSSHLSSQVPRALHLDEIAEIAQVMICNGMEPSVMGYEDARKVLNLRGVSVNL